MASRHNGRGAIGSPPTPVRGIPAETSASSPGRRRGFPLFGLSAAVALLLFSVSASAHVLRWDTPTVTLAVAPGTITESGGTATVTATLSHASSVATTVTVTPVSGAYTVGSDATIVIAADRVTITAVNDAIDNVGNRRATVTGTAANSQGIGTVTGAALTLTDDEATPTVTLALSEPDPAKPDTINKSGPDNVSTVTATLSGASSEAVTLTVSAATKGTNTQRGDFTLSNTRTLTIAAGATTSTGTVTITAADNNDEGDKAVTVTGNSGVANPPAVTLTIAEPTTGRSSTPTRRRG